MKKRPTAARRRPERELAKRIDRAVKAAHRLTLLRQPGLRVTAVIAGQDYENYYPETLRLFADARRATTYMDELTRRGCRVWVRELKVEP